MESEVGHESELRPFRDDKVFVNGSDSPVQDADQDLHGRDAYGQGILESEQSVRLCQIRQRAERKRRGCNGQPDDGEVLEMPSIRNVNWGGKIYEEFERCDEAGEAGEVEERGESIRWRCEPLPRLVRHDDD